MPSHLLFALTTLFLSILTSQGRLIDSAAQFATGDKSAWKGPNDLNGQIHAAWTADALLIGVDVTDGVVAPAPAGAAPWD